MILLRFCLFLVLFLDFGWIRLVEAQEKGTDFTLQASLLPVKGGFRMDDNVFGPISSNVETDFITSAELGGQVNAIWEDWKAELRYVGGVDSYMTYDVLDNFRNDANLSVELTTGNFAFYAEQEIFVTSSHTDDYNYAEDGFLIGTQWYPIRPLNLDVKYKRLSRQYGNQTDPAVWSQNFVDNSVAIEAHLETNDHLTLGAEGNYTNREFNRFAVIQAPGIPPSYPDSKDLQTDQNYGLLLSAQLYIDSILQNFTVQHQRTDSNSYGFSNTVDSFSWAAVVRPVKNFYLELFVRLYQKTYDETPLYNSDLQVGFTDEDSQDLLSAKVNWEFAPTWSSSISYNRMKNESTHPGEYYLKDVETFQVEKKF